MSTIITAFTFSYLLSHKNLERAHKVLPLCAASKSSPLLLTLTITVKDLRSESQREMR